LNKKEKIELYIKGKEESEELKIVLDIDFYNLYLIENGVYTKQELDEFKKNLGSSDYYSHVKEFLLTIHGGFYYKEEYEDYINYIKDLLKENLLKYNFSKRKKRTRYYTEAKVIFMENHDILISNDLDLEIDLSLDLLKHELDDTWIKGLEKFKRKREESTRISEISEEEFKEISNLLSKIRLVSNEKMDSEFAQEVFFYYGFFKEYRKMLKVKIENGLNLNNSLMDYDLKKLAMNGSVFNMFIDTFPTNQIVVKNDFDFFIEYFTENTEMTEKQVLWVFSLFSNLSYLFDLNLDLRLIEDHFKNKFEDEKFLIDTIQVSFSYAKIKRKIFLIPHSELAALSFYIFLIINNLGEKIQIGNICNLLESRQSQINYYLGRVLSDEEITSELDEKIQPNERFSMFNKEKTRRLSGIVEYELIKNFLEYLSEKSKPEDLNTALEKEFLPRTLYFIRYNLTRKEEKKSLKLLYKRLKKALEKRYDILTEKNRNLIQAIFRF
ncbi:MAG: hypothetical protein ACOC1X_03840, partial [Promethearchaeota archaeon]